MIKGRIAAASIAALMLGGSAYAMPGQAACPSGELTNQRLASEHCMDRIPLPSERPGAATASAPVQDEEPIEVEYVETPGVDGGEKRMVRLVGPRFLPEIDEESEVHRAMVEQPDGGWDRLVYATASWFGVTSAHAGQTDDVAEQAEDTDTVDVAGSMAASSAH